MLRAARCLGSGNIEAQVRLLEAARDLVFSGQPVLRQIAAAVALERPMEAAASLDLTAHLEWTRQCANALALAALQIHAQCGQTGQAEAGPGEVSWVEVPPTGLGWAETQPTGPGLPFMGCIPVWLVLLGVAQLAGPVLWACGC